MDPLTQGLLGAAAAQAVFAPRLGHRAWQVGALAGVIPDADILIRSQADPLLAIEVHRQFTHSLAFIPIGGLAASLPWLARRRHRPEARPILAAAVLGYATHGLLDACTTYGTQLLWPFSRVRVAWSWISILDPLFTLLLLAGVLLSAGKRSRWPAAVALALCLAYLGLGAVQRERALGAQTQIALARGHAPERGDVFPTVGNHIVWRSLYQAGDTLHTDRIRVPWLGTAQVAPGPAVELLHERDLEPQVLADPRLLRDLRRFAWFSAGWIARAPADESVIGDVRYSLDSGTFEPIWGIRFHPGRPVPIEWVNRTRDRDLRLGELWREILGRAPIYRPVPGR
jgi:inner membrane protein